MDIPEAIESALEGGDEARLQELCADLHPADAAGFFTGLDEGQQELFAKYLNNEALALITSFLPPPESADLIASLPADDQGEILEGLPDDVVTDLIQEADEDEARDYVALLSAEKKDAAEQLLRYPEESAGGRMTTAFASLREDMTIRKAIEALDAIKDDAETLARIYVVDDHGRILGKVRLRDLTFNKRSVLVRDIMDDEPENHDGHDTSTDCEGGEDETGGHWKSECGMTEEENIQ